MKTMRDRAAVMAGVLSHVSVIYKTASCIASRSAMRRSEAAYWLDLLARGLEIERRRNGGHYEYRLRPKRQARR